MVTQPRGAVLGLALAAFAWLALAAWELVQLQGYRDLGLIHQEAPRKALLLLLPLGAAWLLVLCSSMGPPRARFWGGCLGQALPAGALAAGLFVLVSFVSAMLRAGGSGTATQGFVLLSLLPQGLAFATSRRLAPALRPGIGTSRRPVLVAALLAGLASFGVNTALARTDSRVCHLHEGHAISRLHGIASAQVEYRRHDSRGFGSLECLVTPSRCLPGHPADVPQFLDAQALEPIQCGYRFTFHPGAALETSGAVGEAVRRGGLGRFAMTAQPIVLGRTGSRTFCTDDTGAIRYSFEPGALQLFHGRCPEDLDVLGWW